MSTDPFWLASAPLVLASGSSARRDMLMAAGIPVETIPSGVDERAVETPLLAQGAPPQGVASALACAKALAVSTRQPGRIVLGSDQLLTCDGETLHKPADLVGAKARLARLSGRAHELHSAFALLRDGIVLAEGAVTVRLTVRVLTPAFIDAYLGAIEESTLASVGAYRMEELGAQLFDSVAGDHFTIMGMPLFAVLAALRDHDLLLR
jgi:septum formation protein